MKKQQQKSQRKIVWNDMAFGASYADCMRDYAYHRKDRCSAFADRKVSMQEFVYPGIHRYRVFIGKKRVSDITCCAACGVPLGKSTARRLEKQSTHVADIKFGPGVRNLRTDYYQPREVPFIGVM